MIRLFRLSVLASLFAVACGPSGKAPPTCSAGQLVCAPASGNAFCTNLQTDSANCGACGVACPNPAGSTQIQCVAGSCQTNCGGGYSSTSKVVCGASGGGAPDAGAPALYCADLTANHDNCGKCGNACGSTEVCRNGACDACPVAQCSNVCVDTQHDPANCGACGTTANYCENGAPLAKIAIELTGSLALTPPVAGPPSATAFPVSVKVHSQLRVTRVNISVNGAAASDLTLSPPAEISPTTWTGTIALPASSSVTLTVNAYDEQYLASRSDAAQHTDQKIIAANVLTAPTAAPIAPTVTSVPNSVGPAFKWVPLNAPDLIITSSVATGQNISQIEFRNAAAGAGCPPACVLGRATVNAGGVASLTLPVASVGKGDLTIYACSFDLAGQAGPCAAGAAFTVGRIASRPVIMGKNIDSTAGTDPTATRTLYYLFTDNKIYGQAYGQLNTTGTDLPGQPVGSDTFTAATLFPTFEGTGVYAVKTGGGAIERMDCPSANTTCIKTAYVVPPSGAFARIEIATGAAMLIAGTATTDWYFAQAKPGQTTDTAVAVATLVTAGGWRTTQSGAIAAWFSNGTNFAPVIFHPNISGSHSRQLFAPRASLTSVLLQVFPGGEIVYQFTDPGVGGSRFLGAAYFDGTNQPVLLAPFQIGPAGSAASATRFMVAKPGVILGLVPNQIDGTKGELIEINLNGTPQVFRPSPFDGTQVGPLNPGVMAVSRTGGLTDFAISDDTTKAIYVTVDPPPAAAILRLRLLDLATGTQVPLYGSERLLNATAGFPRFVHSAPAYVGGVPAGTYQAVVWWEELPPIGTSVVRHGRISFANFSGGGPPAVSTIDRLVTYFGGTPVIAGYPNEVESAAAGAIFFLSDNDAGGADLYTVPLAGAASPRAASKVMDRVFGFQLREDKARLLVARSDGLLFYAQLAAGALPALTPIATGGPQGDPIYSFYNGVGTSFGFTPDGDHAYLVRDQTQIYDGGLYYQGVLQSIDLASAARTNWGRITWDSLGTVTAGFIANATVAAIVDNYSVESRNGRLVVARSNAPTARVDTGLFNGGLTSNRFTFSTTVDGNEGLVNYAGVSAAIKSDGIFISLPAMSEGARSQIATYSPFGGPYRYEYSQVDVTLSGGALASLFKVWGGATPPPFIPIIRGFQAVPASGNILYSRQTPDNKELLHSFLDSGDTVGAYGIYLPLSGNAPPTPPPP
jgi:hypothetical protein